MNVTLRRALSACVLAGSLAFALALAAGSADAKSSVVGPGESIQKAINAADPGDTIVVRGVHREDVVIRKDGIKLRGEDAVIEAPATAKADSPCSRTFGPEAIRVLGDVNIETGELTGPRVSDVSVSGFTIQGFKIGGKGDFKSNTIDASVSVDTTIAENDLEDDWAGAFVADSPGTKVLSNDVSRFGIVRAFVVGQKSANIKVVGNHISGGPWGVFVTDAHRGSFVGNTIHDNCAGMFFEAFGPVGDFPSDPTAVSGGVVVATDPYFGGTSKPKNDSVIANRFGRNEPDIFWDGSGWGNVFRANFCNTSVPKRLCD